MRWIRNRGKAIENWLGPFLVGVLIGLAAPAVFAAAIWAVAQSTTVADPSAQVFRDLLQVGAAVFIAFAAATAGAAAFSGGDLKLHLGWLGNSCGLGLSGFLGILASVALAAYREAGHSGWLGQLGLYWIVSGVVLLGCLVALQPYMAFSWSKRSSLGA